MGLALFSGLALQVCPSVTSTRRKSGGASDPVQASFG
jgi:hypothetical protein